MIAFACAMVDAEAYRRYAAPGLARVVEPDSVVLPFANPAGVARGGNLALEAAARLEDLEALVLIHERVELTDPATCAAVRAALADREVALAGCLGASDAPTIAWWEGDVSAAPVVHRYHEHGGGDVRAFGWTQPAPAPAQVDTLDGFLLVFSPWAVRELRFDEALHLPYGHDRDLCRQARAAQRKIVTADIPVVRHQALELVEDLDVWVEAHIAVARKWTRPPADDGVDWRARARRAEAAREAARTVAYSTASLLDARVEQLQARLAEVIDSPSWKLTEPLRRLNSARRARGGPRRG